MSVPSENTPVVHLQDVRKSFGPKDVLTGIDLDIQKGESVVVIGSSGSGKSVLIKSILGIVQPDTGVIEVDGENVTYLSPPERDAVNRKFGMLFQGGALFDSLPVWENVAFGLIQGRDMHRRDA